MTEEIQPVELKGEAAVALWKQGKVVWNKWVDEHPDARINFDRVKFSSNSVGFLGRPFIEFRSFRFPRGGVSFLGANFSCAVDFSEARFDGIANFMACKFGKGDIDFSDAQFRTGGVVFLKAVFGDGDVSFSGIKVIDGRVTFRKAIFGRGDVNFSEADFGEYYVDFSKTNFGEGNVNFKEANFGDGNVDFTEAKFGEGNVEFVDANFGAGKFDFEATVVLGNAYFHYLKGTKNSAGFSFDGTLFSNLFWIGSDEDFGCPIDLRSATFRATPDLSLVTCQFQPMERKSVKIWKLTLPPIRAKDPRDHSRFRRLKELALQAQNHQKALEFHVQEIRARRRHGSKWYEDVAQFFYWISGDYGRSWLRPAGWMIASIAGFAWAFGWLGRGGAPFGSRISPDAIIYSASNMFSFFPVNRTAREQSERALFGPPGAAPFDLPASVIWLSGVESLIAAVLIFMIGLALRNQFRQ